jgi:hypothetical protein
MGMLSFNITCPHCLRENAVLQAFSEHLRNDTSVYDVAFACRSCEKSGIAVVNSNVRQGPYALANAGRNIVIPSNDGKFNLWNVYPAIEAHSAPDNTPPRAADAFVEAKDNLKRGRFDTSVMICRKTIDIATRNLLGDDSKDEKLVKRISMLHGKGLITEQMRDWAHIVRIDSNGAVHSDEEFTKEEAEEMIGFTEVFLLYAFTLPAMVAVKQEAQQQD